LKDEILKRCRTVLTNKDLKAQFEGILFQILDTKTPALKELIANSFLTLAGKINKEDVNAIIVAGGGGGGGGGGMDQEVD
jgi:hypothetical protein